MSTSNFQLRHNGLAEVSGHSLGVVNRSLKELIKLEYMGMQVTGKADFIAQYLESGDLYGMIVSIIKTMPGAPVIMVVVLLTMIASTYPKSSRRLTERRSITI